MRRPTRRGLATIIMLATLLWCSTAIAQRGGSPPYTPPPDLPPPPAAVPLPPPPPPPVPTEKRLALEFTTLNLLRQKGIISNAEFESAMRDLGESVGAKAGDSLSLVLGKWSATIYGFAEADMIYDTTQSLAEVPGNSLIARPGTYGGNNSRFMVAIRNSRLGIRIRAPEWHHIRASANVEMDFLGTQALTTSEAATFTSPLMRARHYNLKVETPIVDLLFGQYWSLFGWQPYYFPASVEIMGLPSMLFFREAQFRISKTIKTSAVNVEFAAALVKPPQRDAGAPEGQGGVRVIINNWKGMQTVNNTGTQVSAASIGVSGTVRQYNLTEFAAAPKASVGLTGWGVAASAFLPVIPMRNGNKGNSLSITGEYVYGYGVADEYTGLTGGVGAPEIPAAMPGGTPTVYTPNVDPGLAVYTAGGAAHLVQWQTYMLGAQYTIPGLDGRMFVAANYSHSDSNNSSQLLPTPTSRVRTAEDFADFSLFFDVTSAFRLGAEYAFFDDHYAANPAVMASPGPIDAINHRFQFSGFYIF